MNGAERGPLIVVAGLPGAGKTTALRAFLAAHPDSGAIVIDSDSVRHRVQSWLPAVPYRFLRPLVHTAHWARIIALALTGNRPLLIHETATRSISRAVLLRIARLARRPARMVWIDVDVGTARRGQLERHRAIRPGSFRRHVRRARRDDPSGEAACAWDSVARTDRERAVEVIRAVTPATTRLGRH